MFMSILSNNPIGLTSLKFYQYLRYRRHWYQIFHVSSQPLHPSALTFSNKTNPYHATDLRTFFLFLLWLNNSSRTHSWDLIPELFSPKPLMLITVPRRQMSIIWHNVGRSVFLIRCAMQGLSNLGFQIPSLLFFKWYLDSTSSNDPIELVWNSMEHIVLTLTISYCEI